MVIHNQLAVVLVVSRPVVCLPQPTQPWQSKKQTINNTFSLIPTQLKSFTPSDNPRSQYDPKPQIYYVKGHITRFQPMLHCHLISKRPQAKASSRKAFSPQVQHNPPNCSHQQSHSCKQPHKEAPFPHISSINAYNTHMLLQEN